MLMLVSLRSRHGAGSVYAVPLVAGAKPSRGVRSRVRELAGGGGAGCQGPWAGGAGGWRCAAGIEGCAGRSSGVRAWWRSTGWGGPPTGTLAGSLDAARGGACPPIRATLWRRNTTNWQESWTRS